MSSSYQLLLWKGICRRAAEFGDNRYARLSV